MRYDGLPDPDRHDRVNLRYCAVCPTQSIRCAADRRFLSASGVWARFCARQVITVADGDPLGLFDPRSDGYMSHMEHGMVRDVRLAILARAAEAVAHARLQSERAAQAIALARQLRERVDRISSRQDELPADVGGDASRPTVDHA